MRIGIGIGVNFDRGLLGAVAALKDLLFPAPGHFGFVTDIGNTATLFQDSAATTPITASGQPVGYMQDQSGNGRHLTQAVSADRPVYTVAGGLKSLALNGTNQDLDVALPNRTATMYMAFCVRVTPGTTGFLLCRSAGGFSNFAFYYAPSTNLNAADVGTPTLWVDGVAIGTTRQALYDKLQDGLPHVLEATNLDLTNATMANAIIGSNTANYVNGNLYQVGLTSYVPSAGERAQIRTTIGKSGGLVL